VRPLRPYMHQLRWRKSPSEQQLLRKSAAVTAAALCACIRVSHPGLLEADLAALYEFKCRLSGASEHAFPPVVGSGANALTIHYSRNDSLLQSGKMVLMDAGCELAHYASDVTRTWPVGRGVAHAQRIVYNHVLRVHRAMVQAVRPGATLASLHLQSVQMLTEALLDLGVPRDALASGGYADFYPHSLGHWLGCDVHDSAAVARSTPLEPGVVLTLEPGLYMRAEAGAPAEFAGIGVRIEDMVLVTETGAEVLSSAVPTDFDQLEAMSGSRAADWDALQRLIACE
jgi:Xaa-Pro aminopeptidase